MTHLQLINMLLRRLREDEVSTYNETDYSTLISDFVNQAKREVEDSWDWSVLRNVVTVTTSSGTSQYTLTGSGDSYKILDVWDNTEDQILRPMNRNRLRREQQTDGDTNNKLMYYAVDGQDSSRDAYVQFWPIPDGTYSVDFTLTIPQGDLSAGATEITVPHQPVFLRALSLLISERGEDGGTDYTELDRDFTKALADAISIDISRTPGDLDMEVV